MIKTFTAHEWQQSMVDAYLPRICANCRYWERGRGIEGCKYGLCNNENVLVEVDAEYFHENFGCIHFEQRII